MGCCPSTCRRAKRDASTTAAADAPASAVLKERLEASIFSASTTNSSTDLLSHSDDSAADPVNTSLEIAPLEPVVALTPKDAVDESAERDIRNAEPAMPEMPPKSAAEAKSLPPPSPRKAAVNFDDVPIDSMYHRLHVVQAEAQDARRQQELRAESERHEREVREFKAAMRALQPK